MLCISGWRCRNEQFLDEVRELFTSRAFVPLPVRGRMDPQTWQQQAPAARHSHWEESGGSGISGIGVGPIFEADFRPNRRAQDAIVEIHALGTRRYHWVFEADIQACLTS